MIANIMWIVLLSDMFRLMTLAVGSVQYKCVFIVYMERPLSILQQWEMPNILTVSPQCIFAVLLLFSTEAQSEH